MNSAGSFATDYANARSMFVEAATSAGGRLERWTHPEPGPGGIALSCDVAWFGPANAEAVLVTISATHGVEGFAGSGAQVDWLRRGGAGQLPRGVAVLLVHAINPHGFAWQRRVTHENVDLNRNWIDFSAPPPVNPAYDSLAPVISPREWTAETRAAGDAAMGEFVAAHGYAAFIRAFAGGQYHHPSGLYFGGAGPTWSRHTQTEIFDLFLRQAARIAILDVHTGLGPWGYGERILTQPRRAPEFRRARDWFGVDITSTFDGSSSSTSLTGDGLAATPALLPHAQVTPVALEIGTLSGEQVMWALIADNWLHEHGDLESPVGRDIKRDIRSAFYVESDDWKGMVAAQYLLACRQAIAGLRGTAKSRTG